MERTPEVILDVDGAIATITINRPDQRNAINRAVCNGLRRALDTLERTPELKVGILTAYMDAPSFASHLALVGEVGEIATVHSDFNVHRCTVPDGFCGLDPQASSCTRSASQ